MAWPSARFKTAANNGSWTPADMNGVQDQYVRAAGLTRDDLETAITQSLGLTTTAAGHGGAAVRRGKSIVATEESRTNTAYGTLTTPDQVANVVLPTDGLIVVAYQALWRPSDASAIARAAIFVGSNQLMWADNDGAPAVQEVSFDASSNAASIGYASLATSGRGLESPQVAATANPESQVTTGQVIYSKASSSANGGPCYLFAAAGSYTVSIQFKATVGAVFAKDRKLWVWTIGF